MDYSEYDEFELLDLLAQKGNITIPLSLANLKNKEIRFDAVYEKTEMINAVNEFLS